MWQGEIEALNELQLEQQQLLQEQLAEMKRRAEFAEGYLEGHKMQMDQERTKHAFELEQVPGAWCPAWCPAWWVQVSVKAEGLEQQAESQKQHFTGSCCVLVAACWVTRAAAEDNAQLRARNAGLEARLQRSAHQLQEAQLMASQQLAAQQVVSSCMQREVCDGLLL